VKDLCTDITDDYFMTISDTGLELTEPHLVRDDDTFVYPLMEETDVTEKDEHTLLVALSNVLQIEIDTSPAPATSLMVQLQYTLSKQFLAYRAKTYLAEYNCMVENFKEAFDKITELVESKKAAIGALMSLHGLVDSKLAKGKVFKDHLASAQDICDGQRFVVVQLPGGEEAPPAGVIPGSGVVDITTAETACTHVADDGLRQELEFQAESLKADVRQLMDTMRTARARLQEEHRDLLVAIKSDMLAVATTLVDLMLQVRGVDYRTMHDMAHKAGACPAVWLPVPRLENPRKSQPLYRCLVCDSSTYAECVQLVLGAVVRAEQRLAWAKIMTRLGAAANIQAVVSKEHGRGIPRLVGELILKSVGATPELVIARTEMQVGEAVLSSPRGSPAMRMWTVIAIRILTLTRFLAVTQAIQTGGRVGDGDRSIFTNFSANRTGGLGNQELLQPETVRQPAGVAPRSGPQRCECLAAVCACV
jgi:hypothetical protein